MRKTLAVLVGNPSWKPWKQTFKSAVKISLAVLQTQGSGVCWKKTSTSPNLQFQTGKCPRVLGCASRRAELLWREQQPGGCSHPHSELRLRVGMETQRCSLGISLWPGPESQIYRKNSLSAYFGGDLFQDFRLNFHQTESEYIFTPELNQAEIEPSGTCWFWLNFAL